MLAGNVVALLSPLIFIPILTVLLPSAKYDWSSMYQIKRGDDHDIATAAHMDLERVPSHLGKAVAREQAEQSKLMRASKIARIMTVIMTLSLLVLWPMPMYGTSYVFSKPFFTGWVVVGILWLFMSSFCVGVYPLWEGRKTSSRTFRYLLLDIMGKWSPELARREQMADGDGDGDGVMEGLDGSQSEGEKDIVRTEK